MNLVQSGYLAPPSSGIHSDNSRNPLSESLRGSDMKLGFKAEHLFSLALPIYSWWLWEGISGDHGMGIGKCLELSVCT